MQKESGTGPQQQVGLWYSVDGKPFAGSEPFFFDPADHPWVAEVESQWEVIRDELSEFIRTNDHRLEPYIEADMVSRPKKWRTIGLRFWGREASQNAALFPETRRIVSCIPGLSAISFNLLEANSTIKPHQGDTNAIMRCHLGLIVPASAPRCGFRVGKEVRSWEEGRFFLFCDAHEHTAWNNTDDSRYVMVVDVFRSEYRARMRQVCDRVLASIHLSVLLQRVPILQRIAGGRLGRRALLWILTASNRFTPIVASHSRGNQ